MRLSQSPVVVRSVGLFCILLSATTAPAALLHAQVAIPVGTRVPVASTAEFSSKTAKKGDAIPMIVAADVVLDGHVVIPKGTAAKGTVSEAKKAGRFGKGGKLDITLDSLQLPDGQKLALYPDLDDTATVVTSTQGGNGTSNLSGLPGASSVTGFMHKGDDITFKANQIIPVFTISYAAVNVPGTATPAAPTQPTTAPAVATDTAHATKGDSASSGGATTENTIAPAAIGLFDATHIWARAIATLAAHMSATPDVRNAGQQVIQQDSALQVKGAALAAQSHTTIPTLDAETQTKLNGLLHALQATPADKFDVTIMQQLYDVQSGFVGNIDPDDDSPMGKLLAETAPVWKNQMATVSKFIAPTK